MPVRLEDRNPDGQECQSSIALRQFLTLAPRIGVPITVVIWRALIGTIFRTFVDAPILSRLVVVVASVRRGIHRTTRTSHAPFPNETGFDLTARNPDLGFEMSGHRDSRSTQKPKRPFIRVLRMEVSSRRVRVRHQRPTPISDLRRAQTCEDCKVRIVRASRSWKY